MCITQKANRMPYIAAKIIMFSNYVQQPEVSDERPKHVHPITTRMPTPSLAGTSAVRLNSIVTAGTNSDETQQQQQQQHQDDVLNDNATDQTNIVEDSPILELPSPSLANPQAQAQPQVQSQTHLEPIMGTSTNSGSTAAIPTPLIKIVSTNSSQKSTDTVLSANEYGNSCRICRWNRSDMKIIHCPCKCKGSVGYIHLKCLKRWIMHRHDNRCEICNSPFEITEERVSFMQMVRSFWCARCCGLIMKHLLYSASLMPLAHVVLQQVLTCMDNLNQGTADQLTVQEVFVASCALLTSSALFFHFFEFVTTRFILIRNILRHWWMFGSTSDFTLIDIDDETIDIF